LIQRDAMKIRNIQAVDDPVHAEHRQLGIPPAEAAVARETAHPILNVAAIFTSVIVVGLGLYLLGRLFLPNNWHGGLQVIGDTLASNGFWLAVGIGFIAQTVDGALGMAYGVTASTFLLSTGASPAVASASVHIAEVFTTGLSGVAHVKQGNVDKRLFLRLLVPGILGAVAGAIVVTQIDGAMLKPIVSAYLLIMGVHILAKAFRRLRSRAQPPKHVGKLALFGGFVDAVGGGGWGPVVTTTLLGAGGDPRTTIGSVNFAEFFLTVATAGSFAFLVGTGAWPVVAGLIFGGLFAAPFAALLCRSLRARVLLLLVGTLISALSLYSLYRALGV
jgi:uncharacterized membrane protein YfcA